MSPAGSITVTKSRRSSKDANASTGSGAMTELCQMAVGDASDDVVASSRFPGRPAAMPEELDADRDQREGDDDDRQDVDLVDQPGVALAEPVPELDEQHGPEHAADDVVAQER